MRLRSKGNYCEEQKEPLVFGQEGQQNSQGVKRSPKKKKKRRKVLVIIGIVLLCIVALGE